MKYRCKSKASAPRDDSLTWQNSLMPGLQVTENGILAYIACSPGRHLLFGLDLRRVSVSPPEQRSWSCGDPGLT